MTQLKIVHFDSEPWDSGLTDYALTLAQAQHQAGHKVWFVAPRWSFADKAARKLGLSVIKAGSSFTFLPALRKLRRIKPDIMNAHTGSSHTFAALLNACMGRRAALIRTRADARPFKKKPLSGALWRRTSGFIAANSRILADFRAVYGGAIPSEMIIQGVRAPQTTAAPAEKDPGKIIIGIAGRLDPVKGHENAIRAFVRVAKAFPHARLEIAGAEKNVKIAALAKLAEQLGLGGKVALRGFVPDMFGFMRGCGIGLLPSLSSEAVSRAAIEWLSQGIPVVACAVGGIPDIIRSEKTGFLVQPGNSDIIADALISFIINPDETRRMAAGARRHYEENFTPERFERRTSAFYEKILGNIPS